MTTTSPLKTAICEFKKKGISIKKESNNPFFKSKYADLPTILDAIEVEAAKCGLVLTSESKLQGEAWVLETTLECKDSDEQKKSTFPIFGGKPQEIGSSITYARRYNIQSLLNLAADDDDGNEANKAEPVKKVYATAAAKKFDGKAILTAFDNCKSNDDLEEAWANNLGAINYFKTANGADADFYTQIVERGKSLRAQFAMIESAGA
jgi:hypothetical protein